MSPLYLVKARDPVLRSRAAQTLIDELLDGEDRSLVLEEFTIPGKVRGGSDDPTTPAASPGDEARGCPSSRRS